MKYFRIGLYCLLGFLIIKQYILIDNTVNDVISLIAWAGLGVLFTDEILPRRRDT